MAVNKRDGMNVVPNVGVQRLLNLNVVGEGATDFIIDYLNGLSSQELRKYELERRIDYHLLMHIPPFASFSHFKESMKSEKLEWNQLLLQVVEESKNDMLIPKSPRKNKGSITLQNAYAYALKVTKTTDAERKQLLDDYNEEMDKLHNK